MYHHRRRACALHTRALGGASGALERLCSCAHGSWGHVLHHPETPAFAAVHWRPRSHALHSVCVGYVADAHRVQGLGRTSSIE